MKRTLLTLTAVVLVLSISTNAFANPTQDKQRKAAEIASAIESNGEKISELAENYNETKIKLDNVRASLKEARTQLKVAEAQNILVKARVQQRAVSMYTGSSDEQTVEKDEIDKIRRDKYADIATGSDAAALLELEITAEAVTERKADLDNQLATVELEEKQLADKKKEIEAANAQQQRLLDQTKGELAALVQQEQQQRQRQQTQAVSRRIATVAPSRGNASLPTNLPSPSPKAAVAIEFARQQLGKPYRWGTSGPNTFDCSGLTKSAWAAAGVSMPHFSGGQYGMFPKVPLNSLAPGDLVFRPGHIGLYIGNGLMIHSPQTGDVVKISPIRKLTGASRPG